MLSLQEVKDYLGIDYSDDMVERRLKSLIVVAHSYLKGSLGNDYDRDDERAKELALIVISDLYDNHDLYDKSNTLNNNTRRLMNDLSLQLKLEARRRQDNDF